MGSATVFRAVQIHIRCYIRVCYNLSGQVANATDVSYQRHATSSSAINGLSDKTKTGYVWELLVAADKNLHKNRRH